MCIRDSFCIVGEPTNPNKLGEMIKIGRRGSLTGKLTVIGSQGHVAYPHRANNPSNTLIKILKKIKDLKLDKGTKNFQPSNLEVTKINIDNQIFQAISTGDYINKNSKIIVLRIDENQMVVTMKDNKTT